MHLTAPQGKSTLSAVCGALIPLLNSYCPLRNYRAITSKWSPFGIRVRIAEQYLRNCLIVHPTFLIQVDFFSFQHDLSVTSHAVPIFLAAEYHNCCIERRLVRVIGFVKAFMVDTTLIILCRVILVFKIQKNTSQPINLNEAAGTLLYCTRTQKYKYLVPE